MKTSVAAPLIIAALTLSACSSKNEDSPKPNLVEVQPAKQITPAEQFAYSGTIEESETIPLSFPIVGTVSRVHVSEGDVVRKGQLLAELDNESYRNVYEMSLASLNQAEDAFKRLQPMYKNGNLPEVKLIEIETDLQKAKSSAAIAKKNLDDCRLYSTDDGIVGKRSIEPGMSALSNTTSIKVVKIDKVYAKVPVPENEISSIKKGDKAKIRIAALHNAEFDGTVESVGVLADLIAHTYQVKIALSNKNREIKPGMICSALIETPSASHPVVVPCQAVSVDEKGRSYVYTVTGLTKASRSFVTVGPLTDNGIEIVSGLRAGETVVVAGQHKLADSASVQIVNN